MLKRAAVVVALLFWSIVVQAQPLADHVPADAVIYVGWQGSESMPPGYAQSHMKAIVDSSNIPQLVNDFLPRLFQRIATENADVGHMLEGVRTVGGPLWRHPSAFFFAGVDWLGQNPRPKVALLVQAGSESDSLLTQFATLAAHAEAQGVPFPVKAFRQGDVVGIEMGYDQEAAAVATGAKALAASEPFRQAMGQVAKQPVVSMYADAQAIWKLIDDGVQRSGDTQLTANWPKVRDAVGLPGIQRLALSGSFEGADWSTQVFLAAPSPRPGLVGLMDGPPVSDDLLRTIPETATTARAVRFDLAKLVAGIRTSAGKVDPQFQQYVDMGLGAIRAATMVNIQADLFENLGDQWAVYLNPAATGNGPLGVTLVSRLRNPAGAQRAISRLELFIDNTTNNLLQPQKMRVTFDQVKIGDLTVHYVALPLISPAWAIRGDILYVGLYPQMVVSAVDSTSKNRSILDNPDYQDLRKRLGVSNPTSVTFIDLPRNAGNFYQSILAASQLALGAADMFGVKMPPLVIPPLDRLRPNLSPAGSASWVDNSGWHRKTLSPFPGAELMASQGMGFGLLTPLGFLGYYRTSGVHVPPAALRAPAAEQLEAAHNQVTITEPALVNELAIGTPKLERRMGVLTVTVPVRSTGNGGAKLEYRVSFLDAQGKVVDEGQWTSGPFVGARRRVNITARSTNSNAADFRMELRQQK